MTHPHCKGIPIKLYDANAAFNKQIQALSLVSIAHGEDDLCRGRQVMPLSYFCTDVRACFIADAGAIIVPLGPNDRVRDFTADISLEPLTHLGGSEDDLLAKS